MPEVIEAVVAAMMLVALVTLRSRCSSRARLCVIEAAIASVCLCLMALVGLVTGLVAIAMTALTYDIVYKIRVG